MPSILLSKYIYFLEAHETAVTTLQFRIADVNNAQCV